MESVVAVHSRAMHSRKSVVGLIVWKLPLPSPKHDTEEEESDTEEEESDTEEEESDAEEEESNAEEETEESDTGEEEEESDTGEESPKPDTEEAPPQPDNELEMSYASGFIIEDGPPWSLVLTCQHVVKDAVSVRVRRMVEGAGVQEFEAIVIKSDAVTDIAVLRVPGLRSGGVSLALNLTPPGQVNEPAVAIGYYNPQGLWDKTSVARLPATSPGCIRDPVPDVLENYKVEAGKRIIGQVAGVTHELILPDCPGIRGVSGGPVVNTNGVIGMASKLGIDPPTMMAVSSNTIRGVLKVFAGLPVNGPHTMEDVVSRLVV